MEYWDAFFELHRGLNREGPGEPADVDWAVGVAGTAPDAVICDAGAGVGADVAALLRHAARVVAVEKVTEFAARIREAWQGDARVEVVTGDMAEMAGSFDLIWSAGAIYFLGVERGLRCWRPALSEGGAVAFSQVCWFDDTPSERSRALWAEYADMTDEAGVLNAVAAAGYDVLGTRRLSDAAWKAYYGPLEARINALRPSARGVLVEVLAEAREEIDAWRAGREEFGYLLVVARPA